MKKISNYSIRTAIGLIVTVVLILNLSQGITKGIQITEKNERDLSLSSLIPHDPIYITSDGNFTDYGFPGAGTVDDPYLIEDYNITTTDVNGIYITGTTRYFAVRNCYVDAGNYGIHIYGVAYRTATVVNNTCSNNVYDGIYLLYSGSSTVVNNTCNSNGCGILLDYSVSPTVVNNTCNNNNYGIYLYYSSHSTVANNTCSNRANGIRLYSSSSSTVANNTCSNNWDGILLYSSSSSTVINNTCNNNNNLGIVLSASGSSTVANNTCSNNNSYGIYLYYSDNSTVVNNTCNHNNWEGIYLRYSVSSTVVNNTFTNCGLEIREDTVDAYLSYTVENNWVNEKKMGFYINLDSTIIAEPYGQLILVNCTNITIRDQILNNAGTGLSLYYCSNSVIINTTCSNNYFGIYLSSSDSSTVANNTCNNNNQIGIYIRYSVSSTVANNTCSNNIEGIFLFSSDSSTVTNNTCSNNYFGIYLSSSDSSTVTNNTCSNNNQYGIYLEDSSRSTVTNNTCNSNNWESIYLSSSDSSTVTNNTCNNNDYGIYLSSSDFCVVTYNVLQENVGYGVYLRYGSDNNFIHHNTFVDNRLGGTSQAYDEGFDNFWYDTETQYGNDWSDWSGTGTYDIDGSAGSVDIYPLGVIVDIDPPLIVDIIHAPSTPTELDIISINVTITDASGVQSVTLHYRVNSGTWLEVSMTLISGNLYSVTIGLFTAGDTIEYYIKAIDNSADHNEAIDDNVGLYHSFTVSEVMSEFQTLSLLLPAITFLFLVFGLVVLQRRKK